MKFKTRGSLKTIKTFDRAEYLYRNPRTVHPRFKILRSRHRTMGIAVYAVKKKQTEVVVTFNEKEAADKYGFDTKQREQLYELLSDINQEMCYAHLPILS